MPDTPRDPTLGGPNPIGVVVGTVVGLLGLALLLVVALTDLPGGLAFAAAGLMAVGLATATYCLTDARLPPRPTAGPPRWPSCATCGTPVRPHAAFCPRCGGRL